MNFTGIFDDPGGLAGYCLETFSSMQPWFWLLFFGGIIGYVYLAMQSVTAAVIVILLTFGIWAGTAFGTSYFAAIPEFSQFLYIVTLFGLATLVGTFIMKRRF